MTQPLLLGAGIGKVVAVDGTKTFTITQSPFPISLAQIAYVYNVTQNKFYHSPINEKALASISLSGTTYTVTHVGPDCVEGDEIHIQVWPYPLAYDVNNNTGIFSRSNPEWGHLTSVEHPVDETDSTVDQHYSGEIYMEGWRSLAIQLTGSSSISGVTFKIWGTLNPDAATPADLDAEPSADWVDMSTDIFGAASVLLNGGDSGLYFVDTPTMPVKFIIQYVPDHATNSTDIFIRRY